MSVTSKQLCTPSCIDWRLAQTTSGFSGLPCKLMSETSKEKTRDSICASKFNLCSAGSYCWVVPLHIGEFAGFAKQN